jgi:flagellar assembly protein FliH
MSTSSSARRKRTSEVANEFPYAELNDHALESEGTQFDAEEEIRKRQAAVYEAGRREGETHAAAGYAAQIEVIRGQVAAALNDFARDRREYYQRVERELVQLALSIARKILHRESTIDPLVLAGMVRVLLERTAQSTTVTVRVNPKQVSDFRFFFAQHMQEKQPEVLEDPSLEPDRCTIQTELGTTEVGPEIQLKEIEQGLLDLEAARPHIKA